MNSAPADATERVCNRTGDALNSLREMGAAVTLIPTFDGCTGLVHGPTLGVAPEWLRRRYHWAGPPVPTEAE